MNEMTEAQRKIAKKFANHFNVVRAGLETYTGKDLERSFSFEPEEDARFILDGVVRLGDGYLDYDRLEKVAPKAAYRGASRTATTGAILAAYEEQIAELKADGRKVDALEDELVREWLAADQVVHFLYGYVIREELAEAARDYAPMIVAHSDAPDLDRVVDRVASKFLSVWKAGV